jgi:hypothetical protein
VHFEGDRIALSAAAPTEKNLLSDVDAESVDATAPRTRAAPVDFPTQFDAMPLRDGFYRRGASALNQIGNHHRTADPPA